MLIESLSGVRAHDKELTDVFVKAYAAAFCEMMNGHRIVIGRDTRKSGNKIVKAMIETIRESGANVIDLGICPTPTVQYETWFLQADGGIMITASHNPLPWNGIKFIQSDGLFLDSEQMLTLQNRRKELENNMPEPNREETILIDYKDALKDHINSTIVLPYINIDKIARKKYKVVVDAVNGAAYKAIPELLTRLGCEVIKIHCDSTKDFPHEPEPLPENLGDLIKAVKKNKADIGLAIDPDGDRLAIVSDLGEPISEEYTLVLASELVLTKAFSSKKLIVTNLSTTMAVDDIAEKYGAKVIRTAIGEINVVKKMAEEDALIGGEGNGGIILPDSHLGRDSLVGTALIMQLLTERNIPLSKILQDIPQYKIFKTKVEAGTIDINQAIDQLIEIADTDQINLDDGVKFIWEDRWVHMRPSNTEPIIRIYAEAATMKQAKETANPFVNFFKKS